MFFMPELQFAVVDVETTGLYASAGDRILEIALLQLTPDGEVLDRFETLINPTRDVGPTYKHGISASDVKNAPTFGEIAGDVLSRLSGSVLVGHNVDFDYRFLDAELKRLGVQLPDCMRVCTMRLAPRVIPSLPSRKLDEVCRMLGISLETAHMAMGDANATSQLLLKILECVPVRRLSDLVQLNPSGEWVAAEAWPVMPQGCRTCTRKVAAKMQKNKPSYIANLVNRLPTSIHTEGSFEAYLELLDSVLEDRQITIEDQSLLETLSHEVSLSREQALLANRQYLYDLIQVALSDGIITDPERKDLDMVAQFLGISDAEYQRILFDTKAQIGQREGLKPCRHYAVKELCGKTVCFTGEMMSCIKGVRVTREDAQKIAAKQGLIVRQGVTKDLDILVVADPDSMSGKAKKAHKYGVRVVAEPVFWKMLEIQVE